MNLNFSDTVSVCIYIVVFILDRSKWISTILTNYIYIYIYIYLFIYLFIFYVI